MLKFYVEVQGYTQTGPEDYITEKQIVEVVADVPELEKALQTPKNSCQCRVLHSVRVLKGEKKA